jgi:limonene-1,2-epoxide hydrolase
MKTRLTLLISIVLLSMVGAAGCGAPEPQPPATQALPTQPPVQASPTGIPNSEIVLNMVERMNAGDVEGSLAYFADDAMGYIVGLPPTGMEVYRGKEELRSLWEDSVSNHFQWEIEIARDAFHEVDVYAKTWHDFTRELGVAPLEWIDAYEVKDGRITTYASTIEQDALARLKPALAEAMPPEPTTMPSSEAPVSEMTVTFAGGTCTTDSPLTLQAGEMTVTLDVKDQDKSAYALMVFNLDEGKDFPDLMASTVGMPPSWSDTLLLRELGPGKSETYSFTLEKGPVYLICFSEPPTLPIGNAGPFPVVPAVPPAETPAPPPSTPTPVPPTDTPSPTAKPTQEPQTLATRAEEIVGEYSIPESSFSVGEGQLWLFLREDGTGGVGYYSATGAQKPADFTATWSMEDAQFKLAYIGSCDTDYNKTQKESVVGIYEVHYRLLGGDRPAALYFTRIEDECFFNSKILTERPWKRYEP